LRKLKIIVRQIRLRGYFKKWINYAKAANERKRARIAQVLEERKTFPPTYERQVKKEDVLKSLWGDNQNACRLSKKPDPNFFENLAQQLEHQIYLQNLEDYNARVEYNRMLDRKRKDRASWDELPFREENPFKQMKFSAPPSTPSPLTLDYCNLSSEVPQTSPVKALLEELNLFKSQIKSEKRVEQPNHESDEENEVP